MVHPPRPLHALPPSAQPGVIKSTNVRTRRCNWVRDFCRQSFFEVWKWCFSFFLYFSQGRWFGVVVNSNQSKSDFDSPPSFLPAFLSPSALSPYYKSEQLMIASMRQILSSVPCTLYLVPHRICLLCSHTRVPGYMYAYVYLTYGVGYIR